MIICWLLGIFISLCVNFAILGVAEAVISILDRLDRRFFYPESLSPAADAYRTKAHLSQAAANARREMDRRSDAHLASAADLLFRR